jgi:hypothetical protein
MKKREKRVLLTSLSFLIDFGGNWVEFVPNGTKEENLAAWEEAKKTARDLMAKIKNKPTTD